MEYKNLLFVKHIIEKKFILPKIGKLIEFGVFGKGKTFKRLCKKWGANRVIGYELHPQIKHKNLKKFDLNNIGSNQKTDIAFCDVDVGDFDTHSKLRLKLVRWSAPQIVMGGIIMCNSPMVTDNVWQDKGHDYLIKNGFVCYRFINYIREKWYIEMVGMGVWNPATWCLYRREQKSIIKTLKGKR